MNIQTVASANNSNTANPQDIVLNESVETSNPADQNEPAAEITLPYHQKGGYMENGNVCFNGKKKEIEELKWASYFGENRNVMDFYQGLVTIWEFKSHLPFMEEALFDQLKENIAQNGIIDPILYIVTPDEDKIVLEGHTRLMAAIELGLTDFPTKEITETFQSMDEIKLWMIKHQFQRRNLTNAQRLKLAYLSKPLLEEMAKKNISEGGKGKKVDKPFHTSVEISKLAGVSKASVIRFANVMENASKDIVDRMMRNEISVSFAYDTIRSVKPNQTQERKMLSSIEEGRKLIESNEISAFIIVKDEEQIKTLEKKVPSNIAFLMLDEVTMKLDSNESTFQIAEAA